MTRSGVDGAAALSGNTVEARAVSATRKWSLSSPFMIERKSVVGLRSRLW